MGDDMTSGLYALLLLSLVPVAAAADIAVLRCDFPNLNALFFTMYSDSTPARIGSGPGVGDRGLVFRDRRTKAMVIIEENGDGIPITFTTIGPDLGAVHSRALIGLDGTVVAPSQEIGRCESEAPR